MSQGLFRNIFLLVIANLLIKPFWILGVDLQVQNIVGAAEYGLYYALFNFSFLLHILLDVGINQFNNREIARFPEKVSAFFSNLMVLKGIFAFGYFGLTLLGAYLSGFRNFELVWLFWLAVNQMLISIVLFARSNFTALQWYNWDAFFSILDRLLSIVFCVSLMYLPLFKDMFSIQYFILAQTVSLGISALLSMAVLAFKIDIKMPDFNWKSSFALIKQSIPFALAILMMSMYTRVDAVMIERLLHETGSYETGIYAASYRLLDAANMIPFLFASILIPVFSRNLEYNQEFRPLLYGSLKLLLVLSLTVSVAVVFWGMEILSFLYVDAREEWYYTFVLLMLTFNMVCFNYVFGGFLTAAGKLWFIIKFSVVALAMNAVFNYIFILSDGASGAAMATLLTQGFMALVQTAEVIRKWKLSWSLPALGKFALLIVLLVLTAMVLSRTQMHFTANILLISLTAVILSFILRLVNRQMIVKLKNNPTDES
jgi:O-antigen/teichoic acid export membrane protein